MRFLFRSEEAIAAHCATEHWKKWDAFERSGAITASSAVKHEVVVQTPWYATTVRSVLDDSPAQS